jgi:antitoxin component YwqK of YwqJK toxin-antitoxin module
MRFLFACLFSFYCIITSAQIDKGSENLNLYNKLCPILGGDSTRYCNGLPCSGSVKDFYPDGKLKHKGYYDLGKIVTVFINYYNNGIIERYFQAKSEIRGSIEEFYPNGNKKSAGEYINGEMLKWEDYFENGQVEFAEEYNQSIEYHLYTHIFYDNGSPKILFELIDKKKRLYSYKEFYDNGKVQEEGNKIQSKTNKDYQQDGIWRTYDESGKLILEEEYIKGMLNSEKKY